MPYEYDDQQQMIRAEARKLLEDSYSGERLRTLLEKPGSYDTALWQACRDMGWTGIAIPESYGGLGLSAIELCIVAEEIGRVAGGAPFLTSSYGVSAALLRWGDDALRADLLPGLASGEKIGAVGLFDSEGSLQPELILQGRQVSGKLSAVIAAAHANYLVTLAKADGKTALVLIDLDQAGIKKSVLQTFDNSRGAAALEFNGAQAAVLPGDGLAQASELLNALAVPLAFEQLGGSEKMQEAARDYALERQAFGQPIGKFQSIKHRIAEMYSLNQVARGNGLVAALDLASDGANLPRSAASVRLAALKAYDFTSKEAIQVMGGMGATWEVDCHLHYRRARSLALELGNNLFWRERLVRHLETGGGARIGSAQESNEVAAYRKQVQKFLAPYIAQYGRDALKGLSMDDACALGRQWQAIKADNGYACINLPKEFGGGGGTEIQKILFTDEESKHGFPSTFFGVSLGMPIPMMLLYATDEQKKKLVPPAIRGENIWCQLFSEPAAGSDLAGLRLRATQDGDNWILRGQKLWTTYAQYADYGVVVARHDPAVAKHSGLTYFWVDMRTPGIEVRPVKLLSGSCEVNEVFFNDAVIPDSCRLGKVGDGFKLAIHTLMIERYAGMDESGWGPSIHDFIANARIAKVNGKPAIEHDNVRAEIAEWAMVQGGLGAIQAKALGLIEQGKEPGPEGSIFKPLMTNLRQRTSTLAIDLQGPAGLVDDIELDSRDTFQRSWISVPTSRIAGGTDETLANTIAEKILGLPQDYRPDKGVPFDQIAK
ncbi:MAG: acyl-CoA dehydrogenase [Spongiibacteraceae bacterium]